MHLPFTKYKTSSFSGNDTDFTKEYTLCNDHSVQSSKQVKHCFYPIPCLTCKICASGTAFSFAARQWGAYFKQFSSDMHTSFSFASPWTCCRAAETQFKNHNNCDILQKISHSVNLQQATNSEAVQNNLQQGTQYQLRLKRRLQCNIATTAAAASTKACIRHPQAKKG